jgi:hypothetical protein
MATLTMTAATNVLKEVYEDRLRDQLESGVKTLKRIEKTSEGVSSDAGGKYVRFPIRVKRNHGIGARNENEALPVARQQGYESAQIGLTYQYGSIEMTGQTFELAESNPQAFVSVTAQEISGVKESLTKDMNRQIYGTSIGKIGTANAAGLVTTFVCSNAEGIYFEVGMILDLYDNTDALKATGSGKEVTNVEIDTPAAGSTTVTFTPAAGGVTASGDYFTRDDARAKEITGIRDIVLDSGTLYAIDPTSVPLWKSVIDDAAAALSEGRMITMADNIQTNGGNTTVILTSKGVRRAYFNLLVQQRQIVNTQKFEGGFTGLAFTTDDGEIPVVSDTDCPWGNMFFLNEKELKLFRMGDWSWLDRDGSMWQRVVTSAGTFDAWQATMYQYCQFATHRRNSHGRMSNITEG